MEEEEDEEKKDQGPPREHPLRSVSEGSNDAGVVVQTIL